MIGLQALVVIRHRTNGGGVRSTFRLGRVAGISLGANWSVLVMLWFVTEILAASVLPAEAKAATAAAYWSVGVAVSVIFFACLVAHEVAHAVVARRHGMRVKSITLWMLGGLTELEGNPADARSDLVIAIVGPAVSGVCALVCGAAAGLLAWVGAPRVIVAGAAWLAITNGLLAVFNMLPGAPLDGGRVLRALIWQRTGNRERSAVRAARAGRVTGTTIAVLGALEMLATADVLGGLWLMLIGWFLISAATAEMHMTVREAVLGDVTVAGVMETVFTVLPGYQQLGVAARHAVDADADFCPVCDVQGRPVAIIGIDQLVSAAERSPTGRVIDVAIPIRAGMVCRPDERLVDALERSGPTGLLLAMRDGRLIGIVTPADVNRARRRGALATIRIDSPGRGKV
jgi:Zn-dependent protease